MRLDGRVAKGVRLFREVRGTGARVLARVIHCVSGCALDVRKKGLSPKADDASEREEYAFCKRARMEGSAEQG